MDLERALVSIGKRCYENCYEIAEHKRQGLTIDDLIKHDPELEGTSTKALQTRLSRIKGIFKAGLQEKALEMAKNRKNRKK